MRIFRNAIFAAVAGLGLAGPLAASTVLLNEPRGVDLFGNSLADVTDVGVLAAGVNVVIGGLEQTCTDFDPATRCTAASGDPADAFRFTIPSGLVLTDAQLTVLAVVEDETGQAIPGPVPQAPTALLDSSTGFATRPDVRALTSTVDLFTGAALTGTHDLLITLPITPINAPGQTYRNGWALTVTTEIAPVPVPASGALLLAGLAGLVITRRRRRA